MIYLKKQLVDSNEFNVIRVNDDEGSIFEPAGYVEATEEEYVKQFADRTAPITSEEDKALGETPVEPEQEAVSTEEVAVEGVQS
jgi:hypothetical protein